MNSSMEPLTLVQVQEDAQSIPACYRCGEPAVVRIAYARIDACQACFRHRFDARVDKAVKDFSLVRRGDRIAVAVSGGKDSAALLLSLHRISKQRGLTLLPMLIDEGIKGYRNRALECAEQLCETLHLSLHVIRYKDVFGIDMDELMHARETSVNAINDRGAHSCSYCGVFRKRALNDGARKLGATKLAVGHNADDVAQTLLMNVLRNEPHRIARMEVGHAGIADSGLVPRIKPLVLLTEMECALYVHFSGMPFYKGGCPYASESFRGEVKDFLNSLEEKHPGIKMNVLKAALSLQENMAFVEEGRGKRASIRSSCPTCGEFMSESRQCRTCALLDGVRARR